MNIIDVTALKAIVEDKACPLNSDACPTIDDDDLCQADVNCDGAIDIADIVVTIHNIENDIDGSAEPCSYPGTPVKSDEVVHLSAQINDGGQKSFLVTAENTPIAGFALWLRNVASDTAVHDADSDSDDSWASTYTDLGSGKAFVLVFDTDGSSLPATTPGQFSRFSVINANIDTCVEKWQFVSPDGTQLDGVVTASIACENAPPVAPSTRCGCAASRTRLLRVSRVSSSKTSLLALRAGRQRTSSRS